MRESIKPILGQGADAVNEAPSGTGQPQRLLVLRRALLQPPPEDVGRAEIGVRLRAAGPEPHGLRKLNDGVAGLSLPEQRDTQLVMKRSDVRRERKRHAIERDHPGDKPLLQRL